MSQVSRTQEKRERFDYRSAYFQNDPGLFGAFYQCAGCGKILTRRYTQVDHIIPLKSAVGFNAGFNTGPLCEKCNKSKGAKMDTRVAQGYAFKIMNLPIKWLNNIAHHIVPGRSIPSKLARGTLKAGVGTAGMIYAFAWWYALTGLNIIKKGLEGITKGFSKGNGLYRLPMALAYMIGNVGAFLLSSPLTWITVCLAILLKYNFRIL